jgi:hypothetical protein
MLSLRKKKPDAASAPVVPAWHPNFRNYEKLPDVKVVRTAFFVNGIAISIALALTIYFGIHEWQLRLLNGQIAAAERLIDRDRRASELAEAQYKRFQAEAARVTEVETFLKGKPLLSDIVLRLARTLPENVAFDGVDYRDAGVALRLSVRGSPDVASGYATAYFEQLKADKDLTQVDQISFVSQARNPGTGGLSVEFFLRFKVEGKKS